MTHGLTNTRKLFTQGELTMDQGLKRTQTLPIWQELGYASGNDWAAAEWTDAEWEAGTLAEAQDAAEAAREAMRDKAELLAHTSWDEAGLNGPERGGTRLNADATVLQEWVSYLESIASALAAFRPAAADEELEAITDRLEAALHGLRGAIELHKAMTGRPG